MTREYYGIKNADVKTAETEERGKSINGCETRRVCRRSIQSSGEYGRFPGLGHSAASANNYKNSLNWAYRRGRL